MRRLLGNRHFFSSTHRHGTALALGYAVADSKSSFASPSGLPLGARGKWVALAGVLLIAIGWIGQRINSTTRAARVPAAGVKSVLHLEPFVVNMADPEEKSYLRVGIDLGLGGEAQNDGEGAVSTALVRDTLLGVLATCRPQELLTAEGKAKLRGRLLEALQQRAPELNVEEVYFTEFLIQR